MNELITNNLNWLVPTTIAITGLYLEHKRYKKQIEIQNNAIYYHERLKVYHSIQEILVKLISTPYNADILWRPFFQKTRDIPFLFGKDIQDKCNVMYKIIIRLSQINKKQELSHRISDDENQRLAEECGEILLKITDYSANLSKIFQPYIGIAEDQITPKNSYHPYPTVLSIPPVP